MPTDTRCIRQTTLAMIANSEAKITPLALKKFLAQSLHLKHSTIKKAIQALVASSELVYTYEYGASFLEIGFNKPVRVSERITLTPPQCEYTPSPNEIVVSIQPGASFGVGRHPSTRLALQGLDFALSNRRQTNGFAFSNLLDIGVGSGVLAIAGVKLGVRNALGTDIDQCARVEAQANVCLNGLKARIEISAQPIDAIRRRFEVITANLRYPTLMQLCPKLFEILLTRGLLVLSGVKTDEFEPLAKNYQANGFINIWQKAEKKWVGAVFLKPG